MEWKKRSKEERIRWIRVQIAQLKQARLAIQRFEKVTEHWLKRVENEKE